MDKKRILLCNEASYLQTGFSTYGLEVMKRLHATGKYELAEHASYGGIEINGENRYHKLPWKYYPNLPESKEEAQIYNSKPTNQWGEWRFDSAALDFKPDIVFDIRDWWMFEHQERSCLRKYFKHVIMPTVDSAPQDEAWMATYLNADRVLTYSDWGFDILKNQGNGKIPLVKSAPPGIDLDAYKVPEDKKSHRQQMGLAKDVFIVGTVMRNQKRKLYPDLIEAFALFLKNSSEEIKKKSYLYLHCAYPDIGWDLPRLIKEAGISNRTIFTYHCLKNHGGCGKVFPSFYQDVVGVCRYCGKSTAILPRSQHGVSREDLGKIISLFDIYVQYSLCEGFGIPMIEAAGCGVPVCAVDYSAMADVVRKIKGFPIPVKRFVREAETHCYKAYPDNEYLANTIKTVSEMPEEMRARLGMMARKAVEIHYNWDRTAKIWEETFDEIEVPNHSQTWFSPAKFFKPKMLPPNNLNNEEFVNWCLTHLAGRPDLTNSYLAIKMLRDLNWGVFHRGAGEIYGNDLSAVGMDTQIAEFGREEVAKICYAMMEANNFWEQERVKHAGGKNGSG